MKKLSLTALALTLALASCNKENLETSVQGGAEVMVGFSATLPENVATKAYSDGLSATALSYYIYDADGMAAAPLLTGTETVSDRTASFTVNLVAGKTYSIVFWAQASDATCYAYAPETKELTVTYDGAAQDENRDAFYAYEPALHVTGSLTKTITLRRPFAQINVGTSDYEEAKAAGLEVKQSSMTVTDVYSKLNLASGEVSGETDATFAVEAIPSGERFPVDIPGTDPAKPYDYLGMNYVLVGPDKTTVDVTLTCDEPSIPMPFTQIPVQRNYRTNIFGALLTDPATFNVEIDNLYGVNDDNHFDINTVSYVSVSGLRGMEGKTFATMAEAYDAGKAILEAAGDDLVQNAGDFSVYTDGGNITWTVSGQQELDESARPYFLTFGRKAAHYGSDKHIGQITVTGVNDNVYDAVKVIGTGITVPYEWWSEEVFDKIAFRNLTLSSTGNMISVGQSNSEGLELTVDNCRIKAFWYCYINDDQKLTFTNNVFDGEGTDQNFALHVQGHESKGTTLVFTGNTVSGYNRGINIDQNTCEAVVKGNTITSGQGYSAVQISRAAHVSIENNTIYNSGDVITIHESFADAQLSADIAIRNNTVKAVDGIQGYLIYDDVTASGKTYGEGAAQITLTFEDNELPANTNIAEGIKGATVVRVSRYLLDQLGITFGYDYEMLPPAPVMNGDVMTVNTENAQYTLDGAYGSIDGKTINFSAGFYDRLYFGRPTKFAGSNTLYRHGKYENETMSYEDFIEYKNRPGWTEGCYYERKIENLTFTAESGAYLAGMTYFGGAHTYGTNVYDYVRDAAFNGSIYYHTLVARNIVYDGIDFKFDNADSEPALQIASSQIRTDIDGVVVKNCRFTGIGTIGTRPAIRYYWELPKEKDDRAVKNLTVENSVFDNFFQAVYTQNACGVKVSGCTVKNTKHNAVAIQGGKSEWLFNNGNVVITDNVFENIGDRIIRFGYVGNGTSVTISGNTAENSGDSAGEIMKAQVLEDGVTYDIHDNSWGEGRFASNDELKDRQ